MSTPVPNAVHSADIKTVYLLGHLLECPALGASALTLCSLMGRLLRLLYALHRGGGVGGHGAATGAD